MVPLVYVALHEMAGRLVPHASSTPAALLVLTAVSFAALFAAQVTSVVAPHGRLATRVLPWIYAGLFLDEGFTRLAFSVLRPPTATPRPTLLPQRPVIMALPDSGVISGSIVARSSAVGAVAVAHAQAPLLAALSDRNDT